MADYLTKVKLPTNGMLYGEDVPEVFTLKAITTREEKLLYGSTGGSAFDNVVQACIVEPKNFDLNKLISPDKHYLMMQLRIHTYGSEYWVTNRCPFCGEVSEYQTNLEDFPVNELDEDFEEPIKVTLPVSKDVLELKLLRGTDLDAVDKQARKRCKASPSAIYDEVEYVMRMARYIQKINGKDVDKGSVMGYVEDMHGRDSAYFWYKLNSVLVGYDTSVDTVCPKCSKPVSFAMPISSEFFRPKFR